MIELTDTIRKEIDKGLVPRSAKVGDRFPLSTGDHIIITKVLDNNIVNYTLVEGPIGTKKVEKKSDIQKLPSNTYSTSNINLPTSEVPGIDIQVPEVQNINVNVEKKEKEKGKMKDPDPYNWYIKKRLKY